VVARLAGRERIDLGVQDAARAIGGALRYLRLRYTHDDVDNAHEVIVAVNLGWELVR
jgi:hypothetical protein